MPIYAALPASNYPASSRHLYLWRNDDGTDANRFNGEGSSRGEAYNDGMRVFLAGASGVIGQRLIPRLVQAGHVVGGMTRSPSKTELLATSVPNRFFVMSSTGRH